LFPQQQSVSITTWLIQSCQSIKYWVAFDIFFKYLGNRKIKKGIPKKSGFGWGGGGGGLFSADIFRTRGILQMRTSALFGAKNFRFLKFMVCPDGQGDQCGHLRTRGRGHFFRDFMQTSFMDSPFIREVLLYKPNQKNLQKCKTVNPILNTIFLATNRKRTKKRVFCSIVLKQL